MGGLGNRLSPIHKQRPLATLDLFVKCGHLAGNFGKVPYQTQLRLSISSSKKALGLKRCEEILAVESLTISNRRCES